MNLTIINPLEIPEWDDLVAEHDKATFFHSSSWAKVLYESYRFTPAYFVQFNNKKISSLIPLMEVKSFITGKRGVSLPYTDFSPPIMDNGCDLKEMIDEVIDHGDAAGWKTVELRGLDPEALPAEPSVRYLTHVLTLTSDKEELAAGFNSSTLRNTRRAVREGITVKEDNTMNGIRSFWRLNRMTRKKHGLPPQPLSFFENIHQHIISQGRGRIFLAFHKGKSIAGAVFFHFAGKALFKYGASDKTYHHLRPNNLLMHEAIRKYGNEGYESFNFGRTDLINEGLRRFKMGWGPVESLTCYFSYDLLKRRFVKEHEKIKDWQREILKRTPVPVSSLIGAALHRHMG